MRYLTYVFLLFIGYHIVTTNEIITTSVVASAMFLVGLSIGSISQHRRNTIKMDALYWMEQRAAGVGDFTLEQEVRQLRRRLAGLLASPKVYLRAHRIATSLSDEPAEITEELEVIKELAYSE